MFAFLLLLAVVASSKVTGAFGQFGGDVPPSCDSPVYCTGPLLHTVQMARIFNDSKTFVDMRMKNSVETTLNNFQKLNNPTVDEVKQFVVDNFEDGDELEQWSPDDFNPNPDVLVKIQDLKLRKFAKEIVALWKTLSRRVKPEVSQNPSRYSLMPLPNGFIIPGGRFKEIYYWDTYWIIRGVLISGMTETARGIIENLMYLVRKIGHVPNGSRVYYKERSQPPLLTKMVDEYIKYTNDTDWLEKNIEILDEELQFWIKNRQIRITQGLIPYKLYQYNSPSYGPRPESYREDLITASSTSNPNQTYIELKSAAESGWDFSSRWFFDCSGGNNANLTKIHTTRLIPVDLNAFLFDAFTIISKLYNLINKPIQAAFWKAEAVGLKYAINNILWNENAGIWQDFDTVLKKHRDYFYVSNIAPLWTNVNEYQHKHKAMKYILDYLKKEGIENYPGGTPTSTLQTGEQWDLPNAWPPLQSILIQSLANSGDNNAEIMAKKLAGLWVRANYIGFQDTKEMFEKYDANVPGQFGGGGEYTVQAGFGWTNGVLLEMLDKYGDILTVS